MSKVPAMDLTGRVVVITGASRGLGAGIARDFAERGIRLGLDRPGLLGMQLRALMQAAADRPLRLMLPMVTEIDEVRRARAMIERQAAHLRRHGYGEPASVALGAMVEVPAMLWQLRELVEVADFVSVGSNDLMQFMTASDRGNVLVADRFDPLSRPFLRALRSVVETAGGKAPVTLCGELAGEPLGALALIGLGYRSLSMSADAVGPVKAMILSLDAAAAAKLMDDLLADGAGAPHFRPALTEFADAHGIPH